MKEPCVYILASKKYGTLYTGVTSDVIQRVWQHKNHCVDGFTKKYNVTELVYFEMHGSMIEAIVREKELKKYTRVDKIRLIERDNPYWIDLYPSLL